MAKFQESVAARHESTTAALIEQIEQRPARKQPKAKKAGKENRTKRAELLLAPSTHEAIKQAAEEDGRSFNDYVVRVLEGHLQQEGRL